MSEIQSLARGIQILNLLSQSSEGLAVSDLAAALDVSDSSASRLVGTLANYGLAEKDPVTRRYALGPHIVALGQRLLERMPLRASARPFLEQLVERPGECAHLGLYSENGVLYIDQVESPATLRVNAEVGTIAPLHCTALGKALLTFGDYPLPTPLAEHTSNTLTAVARLRENLAETRARGYALDDEEYDYGVRCIAAPVFDGDGAVLGALGISGPTTRLTAETMPEMARSVVEAGKALTRRISS